MHDSIKCWILSQGSTHVKSITKSIRCWILSQGSMFNVFFFSQTVEQDCTARIFCARMSCRFGYGTKSSKRKPVCAGQKKLDNHQYRKRLSSRFQKHFCEAPVIT